MKNDAEPARRWRRTKHFILCFLAANMTLPTVNFSEGVQLRFIETAEAKPNKAEKERRRQERERRQRERQERQHQERERRQQERREQQERQRRERQERQRRERQEERRRERERRQQERREQQERQRRERQERQRRERQERQRQERERRQEERRRERQEERRRERERQERERRERERRTPQEDRRREERRRERQEERRRERERQERERREERRRERQEERRRERERQERERRERERRDRNDWPDESIPDWPSEPNPTPDEWENADDLSDGDPNIACDVVSQEEACMQVGFKWSKPHRKVLWNFSERDQPLNANVLSLRAINTEGKRGKNGVAGISSLVVFYASGLQEDMIDYAHESGHMRDHIARNGHLFLKNEADEIRLPVRPNDPVVGVYMKADSWIAPRTPVFLEVRVGSSIDDGNSLLLP